MKDTKKLENKLNTLYKKVLKLKLSKDDINDINLTGFFYSCDRLNILQAVAQLVIICKRHKIKDRTIRELLK